MLWLTGRFHLTEKLKNYEGNQDLKQDADSCNTNGVQKKSRQTAILEF